jgi:Flp pilus assembly protein TadD
VKKLKVIIPVILILLIVFAAFYPALKGQFVNLDDNLYVTQNKAIRSISLANLKTISTSFFVAHYQPVTIFSYSLEYHFFKLNPFNYHLTNLILHLLNCLLVFWVIYALSGKISVAGLTALLFGIHPLQVESVAWISERKNLLYAFFFLGAMVSYLYYLKKDQAKKYYFLCLFLFILSLLSKSMALTLPLVLLLLDYFTSRKINPAAWIEKIPYFFLSLVCGLVALFAGSSLKAFDYKSSYGFFTRLMGISRDIIFYLHKLLFPHQLSLLYPYAEIKPNLLYLYYFMAVVILLIALILASRYTKKVILGSGLFLLMVFPAIRFLPLEGTLTADRYVYLPSIGIFYLLAEGCLWLYRRKTKYYRLIRAFLISGLVIIAVLLSVLTWQRCRIWKDPLSLWNDVLGKYPGIASAYNNRGVFFLSKREYRKALADFMQAVKIKTEYPDDPTYRYNPTYKHYYLNLGYSLRALGRNQEAIAVFQRFIKEAEEYSSLVRSSDFGGDKNKVMAVNRRAIEVEAYFELANLEDLFGDSNKAIALYLRAIEVYPKNVNAHFYLGVLYVNLNRQEEAKIELARAIAIDPTFDPAYIKLAGIYKALGQKEELIALYQKAVANHLDFFNAYYELGNLSADAQKDKEAIFLYRRALEINPGSKEACVGLGNAYLTTGKNQAAIHWLKQALELDPHLAVAHHNLALAYYYVREYDLAIQHSDLASALGYRISPKLQKLLKPYRK